MQELLIATGNQGKFHEITEALSGVPVNLLSLRDVGLSGNGLVEDGETFEENSLKKAMWFFDKWGRDNALVLGEDSGLFVDAFPGELGVKTRRWGAGEEASDEEWIEYFLEKMKDVPEAERGARFVCNACVVGIDANGKLISEHFEGEIGGVITLELQAPLKPGIPLSSCFMPEGYDKVYSALSSDEKNEVSHRGRAFKGVKEWLFRI